MSKDKCCGKGCESHKKVDWDKLEKIENIISSREFHDISTKQIVDGRSISSLGYSVKNRRTGVVEYEAFNLIECLGFIKSIEPPLKEFYDEQEVDNVLQ